jgi:hypothetical protein
MLKKYQLFFGGERMDKKETFDKYGIEEYLDIKYLSLGGISAK